MVSFWRVYYLFKKGGIFSLRFVPGICSLALGGNTNPGYLDVENILSTPSVVEMTKKQTTQDRKGKSDLWSERNAAKRENLFPIILRSTQYNSLYVSGFPTILRSTQYNSLYVSGFPNILRSTQYNALNVSGFPTILRSTQYNSLNVSGFPTILGSTQYNSLNVSGFPN